MSSFKVNFFSPYKKHQSILKIIAISLGTNIAVSSLLFSFYIHTQHKAQREIVTVDILKIMNDYSAVVAKTMHSPDNIKHSAKLLSQRLENVLNLNAKAGHLVIMPKQAVISGAQDITPQIEDLVFVKPEIHQ